MVRKGNRLKKDTCIAMGMYEASEDVNGVEVFLGGSPSMKVIKDFGGLMKICCTSCEHRYHEKASESCKKIITEDGSHYGINLRGKTRCQFWEPNQRMISAIKNAKGKIRTYGMKEANQFLFNNKKSVYVED